MKQFTYLLKPFIVEGLNNFYGPSIPKDIGELSVKIDIHLINQVEFILYRFTSQFIRNSTYNGSDVTPLIKSGNRFYSIKVQEPNDKNTTIVVSFMEVLQTSNTIDKTIEDAITIDSIGRYDEIFIIHPSSLKIDIELLKSSIQYIFETGYTWLLIKMKKVVKNNYILSDDLYEHIKVALTNHHDAKHSLWFVVKHKEHVIFLLDEDNIDYAINKLSKNNVHSGVGPYKLLDNFIKMKLPYESSFALQALKAGGRISDNIDEGLYFNKLPDLAISQIGIFSKKVNVFPIHTHGKNHLFASYPAKYDSIIHPILESNKELLSEEFEKLGSKVKKIIKTLNYKRIDIHTYAEVTGTLFGSSVAQFLKSMWRS
ncbi:hypothetical protein GTQ40_13650 [Flavobacteriaceae bacterium R38]|nr:hypothetical protein [Flavobacteriaceae bacterium R38]